MEVAREVEIDFLHGQYLRISPSCGTTFHTKTRSERRLTKRNNSTFADMVETKCKTDAYSGLTYTSLRGSDRSDQNEMIAFHL